MKFLLLFIIVLLAAGCTSQPAANYRNGSQVSSLGNLIKQIDLPEDWKYFAIKDYLMDFPLPQVTKIDSGLDLKWFLDYSGPGVTFEQIKKRLSDDHFSFTITGRYLMNVPITKNLDILCKSGSKNHVIESTEDFPEYQLIKAKPGCKDRFWYFIRMKRGFFPFVRPATYEIEPSKLTQQRGLDMMEMSLRHLRLNTKNTKRPV